MSRNTECASPVPQGRYRLATRHGNFIFTSGMTPRADGVLQFSGPVRASDEIVHWKEAVVLACQNALTAARTLVESGERITAVLTLTVYVAADVGFTQHSKLADFASNLLHQELGEAGIGSRTAVGVATLPGDAPVEIQLVAAVS